jgi:hypothetical protein
VSITIGFETLIWLKAPTVAVAQSARVSGVVTDTTGQRLPGVSVTIVQETGGIATQATSGRDGTYYFDSLVDGSYRVDFELLGFDLGRRNHVVVRHDAEATADGTLYVSAICECITIVPAPPVRERAGQVVDESGRPIPHARLAVVSPTRSEVRYADRDGRFKVRLPTDGTWPLTATCSGFDAVTQHLTGNEAAPIVFKLSPAATQNAPATEHLRRDCRCPDDLFTHEGR